MAVVAVTENPSAVVAVCESFKCFDCGRQKTLADKYSPKAKGEGGADEAAEGAEDQKGSYSLQSSPRRPQGPPCRAPQRLPRKSQGPQGTLKPPPGTVAKKGGPPPEKIPGDTRGPQGTQNGPMGPQRGLSGPHWDPTGFPRARCPEGACKSFTKRSLGVPWRFRKGALGPPRRFWVPCGNHFF